MQEGDTWLSGCPPPTYNGAPQKLTQPIILAKYTGQYNITNKDNKPRGKNYNYVHTYAQEG